MIISFADLLLECGKGSQDCNFDSVKAYVGHKINQEQSETAIKMIL